MWLVITIATAVGYRCLVNAHTRKYCYPTNAVYERYRYRWYPQEYRKPRECAFLLPGRYLRRTSPTAIVKTPSASRGMRIDSLSSNQRSGLSVAPEAGFLCVKFVSVLNVNQSLSVDVTYYFLIDDAKLIQKFRISKYFQRKFSKNFTRFI